MEARLKRNKNVLLAKNWLKLHFRRGSMYGTLKRVVQMFICWSIHAVHGTEQSCDIFKEKHPSQYICSWQ